MNAMLLQRHTHPKESDVALILLAVGLIGCATKQPLLTVDPAFPPVTGEHATGVAWGDYDSDGDQDLYLVTNGTPHHLFRNDGSATFTDVTVGLLGNAGNGFGAAWADYDNDGDLDLYLSNSTGQANLLFRNDGGGNFSDATSGPLGDTGNGTGLAWGDFDNDGLVDLFFGNSAGSNRLLWNLGLAGFVDATATPLDAPGNNVGASWADFDNDGDLDLYVTQMVGSNHLFRNDGHGAFVDVTSGPLAGNGNGFAAAWGDFDNDGDLDVYLVNHGQNQLLRNDGATGGGGWTFVDVTSASGSLGDPRQGYGAAWGDYDNDGNLDLYISNNGPNRLFRNAGNGTFTDATTEPLQNLGVASRAVAWADIDSDGGLDLYVASWDGPSVLFRNQLTTGSHWLEVDLAGTCSNRAGIGARVTVVAAGRTQIREIGGGSGYSQCSLTAHFGLEAAGVVDLLQVRWPSGILQTQTAVLADTRIKLVEPLPSTAGQLWARWFQGTYGYNVRYSSVTSDGGVILVGNRVDVTATSSTFGDGWVMKLDGSRSVQWFHVIGDAGRVESVRSAMQTADGGYALVGQVKGVSGDWDFWVVKVDAAGSVMWEKAYGGAGDDIAWSIAQGGDGNIVVAGLSASFGAGYTDVWVLKLDATGAPIWQKAIGGSSHEFSPSIVAVSSGYFIAVGTSSFPSPTSNTLILKLAEGGTVQWVRLFGGGGMEYPGGLLPDPTGGVTVGGHTNSFVTGDNKIWLTRVDAAGTLQWQYLYHTPGTDLLFMTFHRTNDDGYVLVQKAILGDRATRLDTEGTILWERRYPYVLADYRPTPSGGFITAGYPDLDFWVAELDPNGRSTASCVQVQDATVTRLPASGTLTTVNPTVTPTAVAAVDLPIAVHTPVSSPELLPCSCR